MIFEFIIDRKYLLLKLISNRNNLDDIEKWKESEVTSLLGGDIISYIETRKETVEEIFIRGEFEEYLLKNNLDSKFLILMECSLFQKYYQETLDYSYFIKEKWDSIKDKINAWLESKVKLSLFYNPINVFISHPKLNVGKCVDQRNIFWGHFKGLKDVNYNIIYLCHENLHALLPNEKCMPKAMKLYYDRDSSLNAQDYWKLLNESIPDYYKMFDFEFDVIHTVIEFISDNELYTILSGESKYDMGHKSENCSLVQYKELIKPYWFLYLGLSEDEINKRNSFSSLYNIELSEESMLSIESFIDFLINNQDIRKKIGIKDLPSNISIKL